MLVLNTGITCGRLRITVADSISVSWDNYSTQVVENSIGDPDPACVVNGARVFVGWCSRPDLALSIARL